MADPQSAARIRDLEQRMAAMPGSRIFVGLAEEYRRAGRFADALATLRNGLEAHPTYLSARIAIARLYQETGRVQEAIDAFSSVLASDRENLVAAKALGDLHSRQGNVVESLKKFKLYRALSGDRAVDERIAALEREAKAEGAVPAPPPPPPLPSAEARGAARPTPSRLFDPLNYADTSGAFDLGPISAIPLSTLEFTPSEEPDLPIETPPPLSTISEALPSAEEPPAPVGETPAGAPSDDASPESAVDDSPPGAEAFDAGGSPGAGVSLSEEAAPVAEGSLESAEEVPDAAAALSPAIPDLPASRTLAELYERQGFPDEARQIYERLAADDPDDPSLMRRLARVSEPVPLASPDPAPSDPADRKRRALETWLARVKANVGASG